MSTRDDRYDPPESPTSVGWTEARRVQLATAAEPFPLETGGHLGPVDVEVGVEPVREGRPFDGAAVLVVLDDADAVELREVALVQRDVGALALLRRDRPDRLVVLPAGDPFRQVVQRDLAVVARPAQAVAVAPEADSAPAPGLAEERALAHCLTRVALALPTVVVPVEGADLTEEGVIDFCRDRLAHYKCPTSVEFRDDLPDTATGKVQKYELREREWTDEGDMVGQG